MRRFALFITIAFIIVNIAVAQETTPPVEPPTLEPPTATFTDVPTIPPSETPLPSPTNTDTAVPPTDTPLISTNTDTPISPTETFTETPTATLVETSTMPPTFTAPIIHQEILAEATAEVTVESASMLPLIQQQYEVPLVLAGCTVRTYTLPFTIHHWTGNPYFVNSVGYVFHDGYEGVFHFPEGSRFVEEIIVSVTKSTASTTDATFTIEAGNFSHTYSASQVVSGHGSGGTAFMLSATGFVPQNVSELHFEMIDPPPHGSLAVPRIDVVDCGVSGDLPPTPSCQTQQYVFSSGAAYQQNWTGNTYFANGIGRVFHGGHEGTFYFPEGTRILEGVMICASRSSTTTSGNSMTVNAGNFSYTWNNTEWATGAGHGTCTTHNISANGYSMQEVGQVQFIMNGPQQSGSFGLRSMIVSHCEPAATLTPTPTPSPTATPTLAITVDPNDLANYAITTINCGIDEINAILTGTQNTAEALQSQFGGGTWPDTFRRVMYYQRSGIRVECDANTSAVCETENYPASPFETLQAVIRCGEYVILSKYTVVHEYGHVFTGRMGGQVSGSTYYGMIDQPAVTLPPPAPPATPGTLFDSAGLIVFGFRLVDPGNFGDWTRGGRGWGSVASTPPAAPCNFQQNAYTINDWEVTPIHTPPAMQTERDEAAADMFLNWVYREVNMGGFLNEDQRGISDCAAVVPADTGNPGDARYNYMETIIMPTLATRVPTSTPTP